MEVNLIDANRLLIRGGNGLYESSDQGITITQLSTEGVNSPSDGGNTMVYGGRSGETDNPYLIYAGVGFDVVKRTAPGGAVVSVGGYMGGFVRGVIADPENWQSVFAIDSDEVFFSGDAGTTWTNITGDLPNADLRSIEYIRVGTDGAVVVGTNMGVWAARSTNYMDWFSVGTDLPNVQVSDMQYDPQDDLLVAGTLGRGAWLFPGASSIAIGTPASTLEVSDVTVNESDGSADFVVSLSETAGSNVTFDYTTVNGTAVAGEDYTTTSATGVTILAGNLSTIVSVPITDDSADEPDETFDLVVSNVDGAIGADGTGTATIMDNDPTQLSVSDVTVNENDGTVDFLVSLRAPGTSDVTFDYTTEDGTALAGSDYTTTSATGVTIVAGNLSTTISVPLIDDAIVEANETFELNVSNVVGATVIDGTGTATIIDNDGEVVVAVLVGGDAPFVEAFNSDLPGLGEGFAFNSTASGRIEFQGGAVRMDSSVDGTFSLNTLTLEVNLLGQSNVVLQFDHRQFNDENDPLPSPSFTDPATVGDGVALSVDGGVTWYTLTDLGGQTSGVTGTYVIPLDNFITTFGLTYSAGTLIRFYQYDNFEFSSDGREFDDITVTIGDGAVQEFCSTEGPISIPSSGVISEATPYPSMITVSGIVGSILGIRVKLDGFSHTFPDDVDILLEGPAGETVVLMSDAGGSGPGVTDAAIGFVPTTTPAAIVLPDNSAITSGTYLATDYEVGETFTVPAPAPAYGTSLDGFLGADPNGDWRLYVLDDFPGEDGGIIDNWCLQIATPPTLSVSDMTVNENAGTADFTVRLNGPVAGDVTFDYSTAEGSALAGLDYTSTSAIGATIPGGNDSTVISVPISDDVIDEADEAFDFVVSNVVGVAVADATGTATIFDDDAGPGDPVSRLLVGGDAPFIEAYNADLPGAGEGWRYSSTAAGRIEFQSGAVRMDSAVDSTSSLNTMTLEVNLLGQSNVVLQFDHRDFGDEDDPLPSPSFTDSATVGDGVAFSVDGGATWYTLTDLAGQTFGDTETYIIPLDNFITTFGLSYSAGTLIRFYQYDDFGFGIDGREFDNITVTIGDGAVREFCSTDRPISIPGVGTSGEATPYPSTIAVSEVGGIITGIRVKLDGFSHTFPEDVDILLEGPGGQTVVLMSDAGGFAPGVTDATFGFVPTTTTASALMPDSTNPSSGTYLATDYEVGETFTLPAPAPPYGTMLDGFLGADPNGDWKLYVIDEASGDLGAIDNWCLQITRSPTLSVSDVTVSENAGTADFTVSLIGSLATDVTFDYATTDGSALAGLDYTSTSAIGATIAVGNVSTVISVLISDDIIDEDDEAFDLVVSNVVGVAVADATGTATIVDDDPGPGDPVSPLLVGGDAPFIEAFNDDLPGAGEGWRYSSTAAGRIEFQGGALRMDSGVDGTLSLNTVTLEVNLLGQSNVVLRFDHRDFNDGDDPLPSPSFTDPATVGDGVAFSVDGGTTWYTLTDLAGQPFGVTETYVIPLDNFITTFGLSYSANTLIRFYQYDSFGFGTNGREFDNIEILIDSTATQTVIEFCSSGVPIDIPLSGSLPEATPYPSTITVGGISGIIAGIRVKLDGFSHTFPRDVDILLEGPAGQTVVITSDAGGSSPGVSGVTFSFVPTTTPGAGMLPDNTIPSSGTYLPSDYEVGESFTSPAPAPPYGALDDFLLGNPNGDWKLYVLDDFPDDAGGSIGKWCLQLTSRAETVWEAWLSGFGLAGPAADPLADDDGDGVNLTLEFTFNLDPTVSGNPIYDLGAAVGSEGPFGLPRFELFGTGPTARLRGTYVQRTASSGANMTYEGRFSGDLLVWVGGTLVSVTPISMGWEEVVVDDPVELGSPAKPRRFGRMEVTPQ